MSEQYSKRDPAGAPQEARNAILTGQAYKKMFGDGKTTPPGNALAEVTWAVCGPELLEAVKLAYRKHHLGDDTIGWEELSDALLNALCNTMGDSAFVEWSKNAANGSCYEAP